MKNPISFVLAISAVLFSCSNSDQQGNDTHAGSYTLAEKAGWMIGRWDSDRGKAIEIWERVNDSTFAGKSFYISGKDTVPGETVSLEHRGSDLLYIPTVKDQNGGQAVPFRLTSSTGKQLVFENSAHDFPQKISYTQINQDSLLAEVSGMINGKSESQKFPMTRIK